MSMIFEIIIVVMILYLMSLLLGLIWINHPVKWMKWYYHDFLNWHVPEDTLGFDGASFSSHCKICHKEILQDSQGNWFEA